MCFNVSTILPATVSTTRPTYVTSLSLTFNLSQTSLHNHGTSNLWGARMMSPSARSSGVSRPWGTASPTSPTRRLSRTSTGISWWDLHAGLPSRGSYDIWAALLENWCVHHRLRVSPWPRWAISTRASEEGREPTARQTLGQEAIGRNSRHGPATDLGARRQMVTHER
jgi:hypothetical protein